MKKYLHLAISLTLAFIVWQGTVLAAGPCCSIVNIDKGTVTGKETATGTTFDFVVSDARFLRSLKVGQALSVNFRTNTASVGGRQFAISNIKEPQIRLAPGKYKVSLDQAADLVIIKNLQTGQVVRHRANARWTKSWANIARLINRNGNPQGQTQGGAEAAYQSTCDQVASNSGLPRCIAVCVLTTTGSDPTEIDDEYSCHCECH